MRRPGGQRTFYLVQRFDFIHGYRTISEVMERRHALQEAERAAKRYVDVRVARCTTVHRIRTLEANK